MLLGINLNTVVAQNPDKGQNSRSLIIDNSPTEINHFIGIPDSLWVILDESATPLWSNDSIQNYILVDPIETTSYILYVLQDTDTIEQLSFDVIVENIIDFAFDTVCVGTPTTFINTSIVSDSITDIIWDTDGDAQFDDGEGNVITYLFPIGGTYLSGMRVYFKNSPMQIVYNAVPVGDKPKVDFTYNGLCVGSYTNFLDESTVEIGELDSYHWDLGDGNIKNGASTQHVYNLPDTFQVTLSVKSNIGCVDSTKKDVTIVAPEAIEMETSTGTVINNGDTVYFTQGQTITIEIMNPGDYDSTIWYNDDRAESIIIAEEGNYSVEAFKYSCSSSIGFVASYGSTPPQPVGENVMNLITPNGDGFNDYWIVNDPEITFPITVNIYNRSGNQVFSSSNYGNDWDGQFDGNPLPQATYYYIIEDANKNILKGAVTIIR